MILYLYFMTASVYCLFTMNSVSNYFKSLFRLHKSKSNLLLKGAVQLSQLCVRRDSSGATGKNPGCARLWLFLSDIHVFLCPCWSVFMTKVKKLRWITRGSLEVKQGAMATASFVCSCLFWSPTSLSPTVSCREVCVIHTWIQMNVRALELQK